MATEADIPVPICETRGEQVGIFVDNIINISVSKLSLEKHTLRDDQFNEHPTVEGENFLRPPSIGEVDHEVNNVTPDVSKVTEEPEQAVKDGTDALLPSSKLDDQPVDAAANEEISAVEIQQNGAESNSTEKDGDNGTDSSFTKEEETTVKNGDKISSTSEDSQVPLHGDEDDVTDHSIPSVAEKSEEASLAQVKDSQMECDEHLEEESERLPSTEVSTGEINDSIPEATHNVRDKDEDIIEAELSEPSLSDLSQKNSKQENTIEAEEATVDAVDRQKESLENLSVGEAHTEINNVAPDISEATEEPDQTERDGTDTLLLSPKLDDQKVEFSANEEISVEEIQPNAEELNSTEKDSSVVTSDDAEVVTQLSKDTSIDQHGANDSYTENIALNKEILEETYIPSEETESLTPCIKEGEELIVQVKTTGKQSEDEKTEDVSSDLTSEVSKEEESDQNKTSSEQEVLANERCVEDNSNTAAGEASQDDSASKETTTTLELQGKSESNSSNSKEEETTAEKPEESSLVQNEDSKIDCDEQLEEEGERLPLTEVSTGATNDNIPPVTDVVEDKDEDLKEVENLSENEAGTCTSVKEDKQIETHAESLLVAPEVIEESNLSQENSINEVEEATIDQPKECLESLPSIVSSSPDEGSTNAVLKEVTSEHTDEKTIDKVDKHAEVLENLTIGEAHSEINNFASDISEVTEKPDQTVTDGTDTLLLSPKLDDQPVESAADEIQQNAEELNSTENITLAKEISEETDIPIEETASQAPCIAEGEELNVQVKTTDNKSEDEKPTEEDKSCNVTSEVSKEGESDQNKIPSEHEVFESERRVEDNSNTEAGETSRDDSASKETTTTLELQSKCESNSSISKEEETTAEKPEESSLVQIEDSQIDCDEQLEEEGERLPLTEVSTGATNDSVPPVTDIASKETTTTLELQSKGESNSSLSKEEETTVEKGDRSLTAEKSEESSLAQIEDSKIECDEHLEEEGERLPLTEVSTGATNDNVPPVTDVVEDKDEDLKEVELSENEAGTCTSVKEDKQIETHAESLLVAPEVIEESNLSQENSINEVEEATIDQQKECLESFPSIVSSSPDEGSTNAVLQEVTSDHTDEKTVDKVDKHAEVLENLTIGEAHSEINNFAPDISGVTENPDQTVTDGTDTLLLSPKLDDQPVESAADEIQQNAEELISTEKDDDRGVVPEKCSTDSLVETSEVKVGEKLDDLDVDDARVATQLSKDTSTENITLAKEISEETDIPIEETAPQAPCIAEGEELNVLVKTTDNKSEDEKPTEEDKSCNVTREVSKEGESDQNKTTSEHEVFESERSVEDNSNTEAGEASRDDSASKETITTLELQSKSESNSSISKEEDTTAEKPEESSLVQIEDSKIDCDEHLEEEGERLPLIEVSTGTTNDNVPPVTDVVEDKDEDLKEVELSENEADTCTSVKEDKQIETQAESLLAAPEVIEEPNLSQEQSTDATLHGNINEADEATINDVVDQQKEGLESLSTPVSTEDDIGKESEEVPLPLPLAREISDEPKLLHEAQIDDGESKIAEFCDTETSTESMLNTEDSLHVTSEDNKAPDLSQEIETRTAIEEQDSSTHPQGILEKRSDSQIVDEAEIKEDPLENVSNEVSDKDLLIEEPKAANECLNTVELPNERSTDCTTPNKENLQDAPEDHKTPTSSEATETTLSLEEQSLAENSQEIIRNSIIEAADKKELAVENVPTEIPYEHIEESTKIEEADVEKPVDSLQVKPEDIKQHDSNLDINNSIEEQIQDTDPREISSDYTEREPVDAVDTSEEILEAKGIAENNLDCDKDAASDEVSTKNTEGGLIKEEESIELEKSIEPPLLGQDRETNCLDEQSPTANTEGVMDDTKEDIADNATGSEEETPKDKENIANTTLHEDKEENTPSTEAPKVYTTESSPVEEEEQVENSVEEEIITANPQEKCNKTQEKFVDAADEKEDVAINVPNEDKEDNSPIEVDGSQKPSSEEAQTEKIDDDEPTAVHEASSANEKTVKANLFEEEKNIENALAKEEVATSSVQDREASYLEEQAPTTNSQLADEKEEIVEDKNYATTPYADTIEDAPIQVDGSLLEQKEHSEMDNESRSSTDAPNDTITESISVREEAQVEDISSNKIAEKTIEETSKETQEAQDIAKSVSHEEVSPNVEDGSQNAYLVEGLVGITDEHESTTSQDEQILSADPRELIDDNKTIDPIDFQKETPADEVPKEIESVDVKATSIELKEEEGYLVAAHQENSSNLEKTPCAEDLDVNKDIIEHFPEVRNDEQQEPSITEVSEEHVTTSLEEPEVSENNNDQVVGEANSCGDRTDSEKIEVPNDGYIAVPTNETLAETDPRESTEAEVNGEEKTDSNNCDEISGSNNSVASQEVSTSNVAIEADSTCNSSQEPGKETREETETEEPQKQDSELQVSEDSTVENIERDAQPFLESADDSGITEEVQNLQESVPLPAPEENITTECKESDVVEEKNETSKVDRSTTETELTNRDDEKEACEEKISDISSAAPDLIQARDTDVVKSTDNSDNVIDTAEVPVINENTSVECVLVNERSVTDLETKHDDEAPEIKETTPSSAEGQDVEENSNTPGSLTEQKSDSDEVAPVQSCDIISETEERKTEEDNLKAEAEIESVKAVADDTSEQEETTCEKEILKDDIPSEKEQLLRSKAEDEDIKDYNQGSCEEEVVRDSHQEDEISKETVELIKDGSHTEMVSKAFEEADDEAPEELEEKILTNEANDKIFHQEEQETSIEEPTTKIDTVKAHELAIASVNTDTGDSDKEGVQKEESEEQNNKDEICSSGEIQAKDEESKEEAKETDTWTKPNEDEDEEKEAYAEDKKLDFASQTEGLSECTVIDGAHIPEDNENSTISEDIALTEQASEAAIATAEVQEAKAGIDLGVAAPKATGIESREVDEVNDKCVANIKDSEVQMAEKDDVVNLQSARELSNESFEVSSNETSEGQETKPVQNAPAVSETLEEETEKINSIPNQLESSIPQSSVEDTAQHEKREGSQQIDSDIKTFDVAELKASPLPLKDKHVVLEADDAKNSNQVEHEIEKPSKVEQEEAECGNEERKPEPEDTGKPSLSELFQVSMRGTAATEKEPTSHTKDLHAENSDEAEQENSKTDEEKDDEEESHEQQRSDSVSEAPVMVDMGDADVKVAHKKSHNILSGVGSKVKHSIAKVKKAITGKSSHPKPPSPKKVAN